MPWENKPPLSISCLLKLISDPNSKSEFSNLADTLEGNENLIFNEIFTLKKKKPYKNEESCVQSKVGLWHMMAKFRMKSNIKEMSFSLISNSTCHLGRDKFWNISVKSRKCHLSLRKSK